MICNLLHNENKTEASDRKERNRAVFSCLTEYHLESYHAPAYGIKYVLEGTEHYKLNQKRFAVSAGHFLIVNEGQPLDVTLQSRKHIKGLCLDVHPEIMQDLFLQLTKTDAALLDRPATADLSVPEFETLIYSDKENRLGEFLQKMAVNLDESSGKIDIDENGLFYNLGHQLLLLQNSIAKKTGRLGVQKASTKTELLRRLSIARDYMDANGQLYTDIGEVAKEAMLSKAHLFRCFKKTYGVSPYQYMLNRKLEKAKQLLIEKKLPATEVAFQCGFADLASFSKAFKKVYKLSPSKLREAVSYSLYAGLLCNKRNCSETFS